MHYLIEKTAWGFIGIAMYRNKVTCVVLPQKDKDVVRNKLKEVIGEGREGRTSEITEVFIGLASYFNGRKRDLLYPVYYLNATSFQRKVWEAAREIPYGETRTYRWLAEKIGNPKAARAVGQALARNPVPLLVPCHRVVSSDSTLGGFTGGVHLKRKLLILEGCKYIAGG